MKERILFFAGLAALGLLAMLYSGCLINELNFLISMGVLFPEIVTFGKRGNVLEA